MRIRSALRIRFGHFALLIALSFSVAAFCGAPWCQASGERVSSTQSDNAGKKAEANSPHGTSGQSSPPRTEKPQTHQQSQTPAKTQTASPLNSRGDSASSRETQQGDSASAEQNSPSGSDSAASAGGSRSDKPRPKTVVVWVNTNSKVYHLPGSRWYGKTRHGRYMTEQDAIKAGYHPAGKE